MICDPWPEARATASGRGGGYQPAMEHWGYSYDESRPGPAEAVALPCKANAGENWPFIFYDGKS